MNSELIEAIRCLHLRKGQTYVVQVDGERFNIALESTDGHESIVSPDAQPDLVPWFDLSSDLRGTPCETRMGTELPFDPPVISDEDREEFE